MQKTRRAIYDKWCEASKDYAEPQKMHIEQGVMMTLLCLFDLYGLSFLVEDAKKKGIEPVIAKLIEAAFQCTLRCGEAYSIARLCLHSLSQSSASFKNVYLTLNLMEWMPPDQPHDAKDEAPVK